VTIAKGMVVEIDGYRCAHKVIEVWGQEDGLLTLALMPVDPPHLSLTLADLDLREDGRLYTAQREEVVEAAGPVVDVEPEAEQSDQLALF